MPEIKFLIACFLVGMILGRYVFPKIKKANGQIILDHNEEGDERICFALNMQYDDFKNYSRISFDVINKG